MSSASETIVFLDLDGTIVEHGGTVSEEVADLVSRLPAKVHIVTATPWIGVKRRANALRGRVDAFCCGCGEAVIDGSLSGGEALHDRVDLPEEVVEYLSKFRTGSLFPDRGEVPFSMSAKCHSFSVLGKMYEQSQREDYVAYDLLSGERSSIVDLFNRRAADRGWEWVARRGGMTGIDLIHCSIGKERYVDGVLRANPLAKTAVYVGDDFTRGEVTTGS